jgi:hypothetical protein
VTSHLIDKTWLEVILNLKYMIRVMDIVKNNLQQKKISPHFKIATSHPIDCMWLNIGHLNPQKYVNDGKFRQKQLAAQENLLKFSNDETPCN